MHTIIVLAQVMNINNPQGKASVLYISLHTYFTMLLFVNKIVLKFACIVIMSDHISKCLNNLGFDQTLCQGSHEL